MHIFVLLRDLSDSIKVFFVIHGLGINISKKKKKKKNCNSMFVLTSIRYEDGSSFTYFYLSSIICSLLLCIYVSSKNSTRNREERSCDLLTKIIAR